ncbi:unnamed protein product [Clonostachys byssicola]|uniref:Arrestin-like N-terminal domain-containing protein n=1 Tax=Clonostachys byssicola TaxID=160290 RepID=A0A9N9UZT9_9HYPO|nr:unnamed protein product [Clonostachys byssicola]
MPQTPEKCGPALGIELDGDREHYWPGDVITGHVHRQAPTVCPTATVMIMLHGRAKSKSVVPGHRNSEHRGEFTLINSPKTVKTLFSGPIHIAADGGGQNKWRFSVPLPPHVELGGGRYCTESFLSIEPSSVAQDELPPSFEVGWTGDLDEAFVEYYLEAGLRQDAKGSKGTYTAIKPIRILRFNPGSSITSNKVKRHDTELTVSSFHLEPSLKNAKLSRSQKVKKVFGTPSVPSLTFKVEVGAPTVIQADDPNPFQFSLRAIPQWDQSSKSLRDVPQTLQLTSLDVNIWTIVEVKTEQRRPIGGGENGWKFATSLDTNKALKSLSSPIELYCSNDSPTIDVGKIFNFKIPQYLTRPADSRWHEFVRPGVVTYNIKITNQLKWEMEFKIAGEIAKVDGKGDLEVLWPPREAFVRPPTGIPAGSNQSLVIPLIEDENPPTFREVQEEDRQAGREPVTGNVGEKS